MEKNIIWQDTVFVSAEAIDRWKEEARVELLENSDFVTEDEVYEKMEEENASYLDDARREFRGISVPEKILLIGELGLWNGRFPGYKEVSSLEDCLTPMVSSSYCRWFIDDYGDFRAEETHHDGTNTYLYRMWKPGISVRRKDALLNKIYTGQADRTDVLNNTVRLGDVVGSIYGWTFKGKKPKIFQEK